MATIEEGNFEDDGLSLFALLRLVPALNGIQRREVILQKFRWCYRERASRGSGDAYTRDEILPLGSCVVRSQEPRDNDVRVKDKAQISLGLMLDLDREGKLRPSFGRERSAGSAANFLGAELRRLADFSCISSRSSTN